MSYNKFISDMEQGLAESELKNLISTYGVNMIVTGLADHLKELSYDYSLDSTEEEKIKSEFVKMFKERLK